MYKTQYHSIAHRRLFIEVPAKKVALRQRPGL